MDNLESKKQFSGMKVINTLDGSSLLLSDRLSSLNFNGIIPRDSTLIYASDLKVGQTIFTSDPTAEDNSFFITRIDSNPVIVEDIEETSYLLYFLGESLLEEPYVYGAENEDGSFSQNHLFSVYKDDISDIVLGTDGWMITNQGNAVFSNVFVRGKIEATSGKIDGILNVGEDVEGSPLVTIGKNIFTSAPFEGNSSEHNGIFLNKNNYLMGYEQLLESVPVLSIVAEDLSTDIVLRKATFTLASHPLVIGDQVSIFGFVEDKFLELDNVFTVAEITTNTFTVYYQNPIEETTNPISVNLKVESFALDNVYDITVLNLSESTTPEDISSLKIYVSKEHTDKFIQDFPIYVSNITNVNLPIDGSYLVESVFVSEGEENPDYIVVRSKNVLAGTYTTGVGTLNIYNNNYKFKVGDDDNSMSYNSYTGSLSVTGIINAKAGNFTGFVNIGQGSVFYQVNNKELLNNVATLTTTDAHSFVVGNSIVVTNVDNTFNGTYTVISVPTPFTFSYNKTADPVTSAPVSPVGTATRGQSQDGKLSVGYGANQISIDGTNLDTTSAIYAGAGNYGNADTGFFMDASGRFSLKDKLTFSGNLSSPVLAIRGQITADTLDVGGEEGITYNGTTVRIGTDVTIIGGVTATSFGIDANNYWNTAGNEGDFRVGNANTYMFWDKTGETTGTLQVRGEITATSGSIEGDFEVNGDAQINGSLFIGANPSSGQRVAINDSGIIGVDNSNITVFNLPATGIEKPTMTNFDILEAKITGAGSNAYLIAGTTGVDATNIVVRGDKTGGQAAAIYSTISGTATSATTGDGFYLDDTGKFRFAQGSNVISGSAGNLSVTGTINATSGNFTSTVTIGQSATQGKLQVGTSTGVGSSWFEIIGTDNKATTVIKTKDAVYQTSGVWLSADGKFSLGDALTWDGATLTISGNDGPTGIIPGNGVDVNQANEITSISGINGLTISSGLTTGARVQLDSTGLKAYNSGGTNTVAINSNGSASFTGAITGSAISGGTIAIGAGNSIFKADTSGIYLGNATFASAPFRVTAAGALTATGATISGAITATSGTFTGTVNANAGTFSGNITSSATITGGTITTSATGGSVALDGAQDSLRFRNSAGTNVGWITYLSTATLNGLMLNVGSTPLRDPASQTSTTSPMIYLNQSGAYITTKNSSGVTAGLIVDEASASVLTIGDFNGASAAEIGRLANVTSNIQTQLNAKLGTTAKAADANLLDGINSTSFLRSDASDSWASATFTLKPTGATYGLVFDAGFTDTAGDPVIVSNGTAHAYGRIGRPANRMYAGYFSLLYAGTSQITSDIREKTSIENSDLGLDFINMLRPVKYKMINGIKKQVDAEGNPVEDTPGTRWHYGLIAQEVKETLDSYNLDSAMWAVEDFETNPDGRQAISYNQIVSPLIKAVQQLSETVEVLENRLAALES